MAARLEIHLEAPEHALTLPETWPTHSPFPVVEVMQRLLTHLHRHRLQMTCYTLGYLARHEPDLLRNIQDLGHRVGSHGYWHRSGEREGDASDQKARQYLPDCVGYRSPFWWSTPRPGWCGGVFFRVLPYWWIKQEIERTGMLYLHPHDLMGSTPGHWRRLPSLCDPWQRLERLLTEVRWEN